VRRRQARWLDQRLNAWRRGELMEDFSALCVVLVILMPFSLVRWAPVLAFVPFLAPLAYLFAVSPTFFRGKPAPVTVARMTHAAAGAQQTATPAEGPHTYV
jgi:hypothetical protein